MAATPSHSPVLKETAHHRQRSRPSARLNTEIKIWSRRSAYDPEALEGDTHYLAGLLRVLDDEGFGIEACSKAWKFLASDDSHDLFTRTSNFVQKQHFCGGSPQDHHRRPALRSHGTIQTRRRGRYPQHKSLVSTCSKPPRNEKDAQKAYEEFVK